MNNHSVKLTRISGRIRACSAHTLSRGQVRLRAAGETIRATAVVLAGRSVARFEIPDATEIPVLPWRNWRWVLDPRPTVIEGTGT